MTMAESLICSIDTYFLQVCNLSYERKLQFTMKCNEAEGNGYDEVRKGKKEKGGADKSLSFYISVVL